MARIAFGATLGQSLGEGRFNTRSGSISPAATSAAAVTAAAVAVDAAVVVLVADGATPTEAHVTTLNDAWVILAAAIVAGAAGTASANVVLDIDTAVVTTQNGVRAALRQIEQTLKGSGLAP